jgi:hypothetical protein
VSHMVYDLYRIVGNLTLTTIDVALCKYKFVILLLLTIETVIQLVLD